MSYRHFRQREHAERVQEGVYEGALASVAAFGEYLAENGQLGHGVAEITASMTVADLVEAFVKDAAGQKVLGEWADQVAEDEEVERDMQRYEGVA